MNLVLKLDLTGVKEVIQQVFSTVDVNLSILDLLVQTDDVSIVLSGADVEVVLNFFKGSVDISNELFKGVN
jgi:hypothetical protein